MKFAKWVFLTAAIIGLLSTVPLLFAENLIQVKSPEFFYGFVFLNICLQILYLFVSTDPVRYRLMMIPSFLAKASGAIMLIWLFFAGRVSTQWLGIAAVDGIFAALFLAAYITVKPRIESTGSTV
jgi:Na+/H+ antiporter NhaA